MRMRLYEALIAGGPATAAQLARDVPGAPGSLSYHLRTLAAHKFIEEAPELTADGRERWWRAVPGGAHWAEDDLDRSPGMRKAATAAQLVFLSRQQDRLRDWLEATPKSFGSEWRSAAVSNDIVLHLNSNELRELGHDLDEVTDRWLGRSRSNRQAEAIASGRLSLEDADGGIRPVEAEKPTEGLTRLGRMPVILVTHAFPFSVLIDKARPGALAGATSEP